MKRSELFFCALVIIAISMQICGLQAGMSLDFYGKINGKGSTATSYVSRQFPDNPTEVTYASSMPGFSGAVISESTGFWEWPQPFSKGDSGNDGYLGIAQGLFIAPMNGTYQFFMQSDDTGYLYITKTPLAISELKDDATRPPHDATSRIRLQLPDNYTGIFTLSAGDGLYITSSWGDIHRHDWMNLEVSINGGPYEVLPLGHVQRYRYSQQAPAQEGLSIVGYGANKIIQNSSIDVVESEEAHIYVEFDKVINDTNDIPHIVWTVNGEIQENQHGSHFTFLPEVDANESRSVNSFGVSVEGIGKAQFEVFVNLDKAKPELLHVNGSGNPKGIIATFNEPVDIESATYPSNYLVVGQEVDIESVEMISENSVLIKTSDFSSEPIFLQVRGVADASISRNAIDETTSKVIVNSNLLTYWSFDNPAPDGNAIIFDDIAGNLGEIMDGAAFTPDAGGASGMPGDYALDFGADLNGRHLLIQDASLLDAVAEKNQITISFWQKNNGYENAPSFILHNSYGVARVYIPWNKHEIYFDTGGCCDSARNRIFNSIRRFPDHYTDFLLDWHFYTFVKNGDLKEIWIDGKLFHSGSNSETLKTGFTSMTIGTSQVMIDEFSIFAESLSQDQIRKLSERASPMDMAYPVSEPLILESDLSGGTVDELEPLELAIKVSGGPEHSIGYQWFRNDEPIPYATRASLKWSRVPASEHGNRIRVEAFNTDGTYNTIVSKEITINVNTDIPAPDIVKIYGNPFNNRITMIFDREVDPENVSPGIFRINSTETGYSPPLAIINVTISEGNRRIILDTAPQAPGATYVIQIERLTNLSATPSERQNLVQPFTSMQKKSGGATALLYPDNKDPELNFYPRNERGSGKFPPGWSPFRLEESSINNVLEGYSSILNYLESPNSGDINQTQLRLGYNYNQIIFGWIIPPESGNYIFPLAVNSVSELYLSTNDNPGNSRLIGGSSRRGSEREYNGDNGKLVSLEAGKEYYFELITSSSFESGYAAMSWNRSPDESWPDIPESGSHPISGENLVSYLPSDESHRKELSIGTDGKELFIKFNGNLQSAPNLYGPWENIPDAVNPHIEPINENHRFFRMNQ